MMAREERLLGDGARHLLDLYRDGQYAPLLAEVDQLAKEGQVGAPELGLTALALTALERHEEAVKAAGEAVKRAPDQAWLHDTLAAAEAGLGRLERATEAQRRAAQLLPGEPAYTARLAKYQRLNGEHDLAVRTARQALLTDPGHPEALNELGLALQATGDTAGALAQFRAAQEAAPAAAEAYVNEGVLHLRAGARGEARRAFRAAVQRRPGWEEAENYLVRSMTGERGPLTATLLHLLNLGRFTLVGWLIVAFLYYLLFRLLEFVWKAWPATLPLGRGLLMATLVYLLGGLAVGKVLRFLLRRS
ncbi:MAG TPA: tetratricopeptide repeat protein [Symbiobacteriaceae bacterium]|jgi:Flp pilus assembly protein TadD|nr:tetratricopeptide repeat protein [Symbiobacteriaceae bacterium]